ncbi:hypothetical protein BDZ89DRAFT_1049126 [Hymenopellis radicata]|nr:hypothetical protein BDZ89DRAFT_1049126 [Hymenopellis radicata]
MSRGAETPGRIEYPSIRVTRELVEVSSTIEEHVTPHEAMYEEKPSIAHLRIWGCRVFIQVPAELRAKMGDRMVEGIYVSYEENHQVVFDELTPGKLSSKKHFYDPPPPHLSLARDDHQPSTPEVYDWLHDVRSKHGGAPLPTYQDIRDYTSLHIFSALCSEDVEYSIPTHPVTLLSYTPPRFPHLARSWDLSKEPLTYEEAMARPDTP